MVAPADLRVRGRTGHFVAKRPPGMMIRYIGRGPATADESTLESQFPVLPNGEAVKAEAYIRKAIADGELELVKEA